MSSLAEEMPKEMARVRALKEIYLELPGGGGRLAAAMMEQDLQAADRAVMSGDLVEMIHAFNQLRTWEDD